MHFRMFSFIHFLDGGQGFRHGCRSKHDQFHFFRCHHLRLSTECTEHQHAAQTKDRFQVFHGISSFPDLSSETKKSTPPSRYVSQRLLFKRKAGPFPVSTLSGKPTAQKKPCIRKGRTVKRPKPESPCGVSFSNAEGTAVSGSALNRDSRCGPGSIAQPQEQGLEDMFIMTQSVPFCQVQFHIILYEYT